MNSRIECSAYICKKLRYKIEKDVFENRVTENLDEVSKKYFRNADAATDRLGLAFSLTEMQDVHFLHVTETETPGYVWILSAALLVFSLIIAGCC